MAETNVTHASHPHDKRCSSENWVSRGVRRRLWYAHQALRVHVHVLAHMRHLLDSSQCEFCYGR
jgi:hypothetical protein